MGAQTLRTDRVSTLAIHFQGIRLPELRHNKMTIGVFCTYGHLIVSN